MGHVEEYANRTAHAVNKRDAGVGERDAGHGRRHHHAFSRRTIRGLVERGHELVPDDLHRFQRERIGKSVGLTAYVRLNRMRERVRTISAVRRWGILIDSS